MFSKLVAVLVEDAADRADHFDTLAIRYGKGDQEQYGAGRRLEID